MQVVHKFELLHTLNLIRMPRDAKILHFGIDPRGVVCLWALVIPNAQMVNRTFVLFGTGHAGIRSFMEYVGTVKVDAYMVHCFEDRG